MGEQPILWSKLNLTFNVFKVGRGSEQWEGPASHPDRWSGRRVIGVCARVVDGMMVPDVDNCGWTEELVKVLTLPRLQSLEQLTLSFFFMSKVFWEDCIHFLQLVSDFAPSVRKLTWREGSITVTPNPTPVEELAQQLVEKLVKFEEVHFPSVSFDVRMHRNYTNPLSYGEYLRFLRFEGIGINAAILRALPAASGEEGSKLKSLTLHCCQTNLAGWLAEAQKKLTVNIIS